MKKVKDSVMFFVSNSFVLKRWGKMRKKGPIFRVQYSPLSIADSGVEALPAVTTVTTYIVHKYVYFSDITWYISTHTVHTGVEIKHPRSDLSQPPPPRPLPQSDLRITLPPQVWRALGTVPLRHREY
jgi:hypothetical protein